MNPEEEDTRATAGESGVSAKNHRMYYLKHYHEFAWKIQHKVSVEW